MLNNAQKKANFGEVSLQMRICDIMKEKGGSAMCGRFTFAKDAYVVSKYLQDNFQINTDVSPYKFPKYNIAPSQDVLSLIHDGKNYRAGLLKWGYIPTFAKDETSNVFINAKSETLAEKPSFLKSLEKRRCIILADGFYEWKQDDHVKTPYRIKFKEDTIFPMAAIWTYYERPDGSKLYTTAIVTTKANDIVSSIHDRMPVILDPDALKIWMNPYVQDTDVLLNLLTPHSSSDMTSYEVSDIVNSSRIDLPSCIEEIKTEE